MLRTLLLAMSLLCTAHAQAVELIVSAAASLTNSFREIGRLFEAAHPADKIVFNFASSDVLLAQIARGAPVDVFATADADSMDRAEKKGLLLPGSRRDLLQNALVLVVPANASAMTTDLTSLGRDTVRRIAVGNPASVPAGRYAREALEKAGLWTRLQPKLIYAQNVRQALDYVARGEVDAGLVYLTDAAIIPGKIRIAAEVPTATPIVYPIAVVNGTRNRTLAGAFMAHLRSQAAQTVFARHGFRPYR